VRKLCQVKRKQLFKRSRALRYEKARVYSGIGNLLKYSAGDIKISELKLFPKLTPLLFLDLWRLGHDIMRVITIDTQPPFFLYFSAKKVILITE